MRSFFKTAAIAAFSLTLLGCATASAPAPLAQGDWVLARWQDDREWYFPAIVTARTGNDLALQYDDGDTGTQSAENVRAFDWDVGTHLSCRWSDENWYPARITQMSPNRYDIRVRYDDGDKGDINTSRCRSQ